MQYEPTTSLTKILGMRSRLRICQGGARAGKTIAILMCLIDMAGNPTNGKLVISVVSETLPHLRRGAVRDFLAIMEGRGYFKDASWNRSDYIYRFETGSIIEFFSADSPDKVRGPARDVLFINECNNVPYETYRQLALRTRKVIYLDFNPVSEFYVHTELIPKRPHDFVRLTYLDNEALSKEIVEEIEAMKDNENLWRIYGLGEIGTNEGQIYTNWEIIPEVPEEAQLERHSSDFGYTNDPAAVVDIYRWNGGFVVDELAYGRGLNNRSLANAIRVSEGLKPVGEHAAYEGRTRTLSIGDSAEPKSIDEIKTYGVNMIGSAKGADSRLFGIQLVQVQTVYLTQRSLNVIKEYRNYIWKVDKRTGKSLNVDEHEFSHGMDAIRYGITDILNPHPYVFRVRGPDD